MINNLITFFTYIKDDHFLIAMILGCIIIFVSLIVIKKINLAAKILGLVGILLILSYTYVAVMAKYEYEAKKKADEKTYHYMYMECNETGEIKTLYKEFTKANPLRKEEMDALDKQTDICWKIEAIQQGWHIGTISREGGEENNIKKAPKKDRRIEEIICSYYSHICWPHRDSRHTCVIEPELCQYPHLVDDTPLTIDYVNKKIIDERESGK